MSSGTAPRHSQRPGLAALPPVLREAEPMIRRAARSVIRRASHFTTVEDLEQEARLAIWLASDVLPTDPEHRAAYLRKRVRGAMIDAMRRESWTPRTEHHSDDVQRFVSIDAIGESHREQFEQIDHDTPDDHVYAAQAASRLRAVIERAPPRLREMWEGLADGLTMSAVAKQLGVSGGRVTRMHQDMLTLFRRALTRA
jgi:RNA polymerase sigma factor (sigma-70 family)